MKSRSQSKFRAQAEDTFQEVLSRRIARRSFLKGALLTAPVLVLGPSMLNRQQVDAIEGGNGLGFHPIGLDDQDRILVAEGYDAKVLIRWGDPLFQDSPAFDPFDQSKTTQEQQFGYNCDYVAYLPLPHHRANNPTRALLWVNHEYTNEAIMFPGYSVLSPTQAQIDVALAAHGASVVEIRRTSGKGWEVVAGSPYNRRITGETHMQITGPAAGDEMMKVSYDQTGRLVHGMLNNCGGGTTPWGTVLTCEENFNQYFANRASLADSDERKPITPAMAWVPVSAACRAVAANAVGNFTMIVSISRKIPTNRSDSAGSSRSIPTIPTLFRRSAPL